MSEYASGGLIKGPYARGGLIAGPDGAVNVPIRLTVGERLISTNGEVWEWTAVPDTDPQMYQWVRVNTDEQAAAWVAWLHGQRPNKFNQPKEPE